MPRWRSGCAPWAILSDVTGRSLLAILLLLLPQVAAAGGRDLLCTPALHEERVELEELRLGVGLARSDFEAYQKIYALIESLWEKEAIERMGWLRAKYDRDSAELSLARAEMLIERQEALVEQYEIVCEGSGELSSARRRALDEAGERYLRADCDQQAKQVEVARVDLEFQKEWLASILDLREGDVATVQDVILAELELEQDELRLADATRRSAACREATGSEESE